MPPGETPKGGKLSSPVPATGHGRSQELSPQLGNEAAALLGLQRSIGNAATLRLLGAQALPGQAPTLTLRRRPVNRPIVQRLVKIKFEEPAHEMEQVDPALAKIENVLATRDQTPVSVENKNPSPAQRAHATANAVFAYMWVRALDQKTWLQAWTVVRQQYKFLQDLLDIWLADNTLKAGAAANIKNQLPGLIQHQLDLCDAELSRDGHKLTDGPVWAARPLAGTIADWKYYDHEPKLATDGIDSSTHLIKPWVPLLNSAQVGKLETACEQWMLLRGQIPWTSVDAESYVRGDMAGPGMVDASVATHQAKADLTNTEAKDIAKGIAVTFDFFPPSFTLQRTINHAAAVAARHLVEHFQYHPDIKPAWRNKIKAQFLVVWAEKIAEEKAIEDDKAAAAEKKRKEPKSRQKKVQKVDDGRPTDALNDLQTNWNAVKAEFGRVYDLLAVALV